MATTSDTAIDPHDFVGIDHLLSDDEKKNLDKAAEPKKDGEAKKDAPAAK